MPFQSILVIIYHKINNLKNKIYKEVIINRIKFKISSYAKIWLKGYAEMKLKPFTLPFTTLS